VATIIKADCAGCHNGTQQPLLTPEATFRTSPIITKLSSGQMPPPPRTIADADKAALLAFAASPVVH
jgi:hypothetical protein